LPPFKYFFSFESYSLEGTKIFLYFGALGDGEVAETAILLTPSRVPVVLPWFYPESSY
jgi:hypothetical protein